MSDVQVNKLNVELERLQQCATKDTTPKTSHCTTGKTYSVTLVRPPIRTLPSRQSTFTSPVNYSLRSRKPRNYQLHVRRSSLFSFLRCKKSPARLLKRFTTLFLECLRPPSYFLRLKGLPRLCCESVKSCIAVRTFLYFIT